MVLADGRIGRSLATSRSNSRAKKVPTQRKDSKKVSQRNQRTFVIKYALRDKKKIQLGSNELKKWLKNFDIAKTSKRLFGVQILKQSWQGDKLTVTLKATRDSARDLMLTDAAEFIADPDHDGNDPLHGELVIGRIVKV